MFRKIRKSYFHQKRRIGNTLFSINQQKVYIEPVITREMKVLMHLNTEASSFKCQSTYKYLVRFAVFAEILCVVCLAIIFQSYFFQMGFY